MQMTICTEKLRKISWRQSLSVYAIWFGTKQNNIGGA